ncbi:MAG TPA: transglutaminase-like domain-containing protein [Gemmatimonadales bacterium]|nr:transglutaminase-like domain-containing protein [Gemmatimonadales bacterium]
MSRRHWAIAILAAWALSLGWLVKLEVFRSTGARLAEAALSVPPGALFYRLDLGGQQIGFTSATLDTVPDSIRVENVFVLDVAALGKLHRTTARSVALLSRALRLQRVDVTFDGDLGQFAAHGRVLGDTILAVAIVSDRDSQVTRIPLTGPITLPTLLPLRLAFGGELQPGRTYTARLFDPLLLAARDVTVRVAAESTLVVSDSADLDSTTMVWLPEHFDTVRAFRIDQDANGVPLSSWIDAQGRLVRASSPTGFAMERAAFEIAYENFRRRDTARVARSSAAPGPDEIVPVTALAAGVPDDPASLARLRIRFSGVGLHSAGGPRQRVSGDTLEIVRETAVQSHAMPYSLPSRDTALARWLAPEPLIQSRDPRIAAQARLIIERERSPARAAELLTHWVHRNVRREETAGVPSAEKVLESRRGDCNEQATLYVALARAAGLPARTAAGVLYLKGRFYYHAWPEVYLGDWVAVDPTFDQFPADATHLRFAVGGLARQVELIPLIGRLKLEVL